MQDCDYYVDSEEDEVFFGCVNIKEKVLYSKLSAKGNSDSSQEDFNNSLVELDHNYSTFAKQIDKSILTTPKSVVKADKDGGFLKVLSEIALVKAEAESIKLEEKGKEDEDKENKVTLLPDIIVTEPTPEKSQKLSPKNLNSRLKRFQMNKNLPSSNNVHIIYCNKAKSFSESQNNKSSINNGNKNIDDCCYIKNSENHFKNVKKARGSSWPNSINWNDKSYKIIPALEPTMPNTSNRKEDLSCKNIETNILKTDKSSEKFNENFMPDISANSRSHSSSEDRNVISNLDIYQVSLKNKFEEKIDSIKLDSEQKWSSEENDCTKELEKPDSYLFTNIKEIAVDTGVGKTTDDKNIDDKLLLNLRMKSLEVNYKETVSEENQKSCNNEQEDRKTGLPVNYRFSKEARKLVEELKKSVIDDTLPEIDFDEIENSFLSPALVPTLDETVVENKNSKLVKSPKLTPVSTKMPNKNQSHQKECHITKSLLSQSKIPHFKSSVENKVFHNQNQNQAKKCAQKSKLEEKIIIGGKGEQSKLKKFGGLANSKIPIPGSKDSKLPSRNIGGQPSATKITPLKTPNGKLYRNPKFKNVESPINAYIHNKPTSLVVNVKPTHVKKSTGIMKMCKEQVSGIHKNEMEKTPKRKLGLPIVEYSSATPYVLEEHSERRLPRLAPSVERLVRPNYPIILQHKGRYYLKTPTKNEMPSTDNTILADSNEVSLLISKVALKGTPSK